MAMATLSYPHQCRSPGDFLPSFHGLRANFSVVKMPISSIPRIRRNRIRDCRIQAAVLPLISFDGQSLGNTELELRTARPETAKAVVHRGLITEMANKRQGTASTLTRAEVRGGGRKPYKQKGTGNARRGSQRTPLRPGGGVIFGPKPKDWSMKINKKEKRLAITTALQSAAVNAVVVEDFDDKFQTPKTRDFISALNAWGIKEQEHSLIFTTEVSTNLSLSSRNLKTVKLVTPRTLNLYDVLRADKLVFTKSGVDYLNQMYGMNASEDEDEP